MGTLLSDVAQYRPTVAIIDAAAIAENVRVLRQRVAPAAVCAVVKADGYGHGAVAGAQAALHAGATWLAVALVEEAIELRLHGVRAPILVLSEFPRGAGTAIIANALTATVYSHERIAEMSEAAAVTGVAAAVHLKVDTGMRRVGAQPGDALTLASAISSDPHLSLGGTFTHFAVSDEPSNPFTSLQHQRFIGILTELRRAGIDPGIVHAANSGGGIVHSASHLDMVRFGVSIYGNSPDAALDCASFGVSLTPVLTLRSEVSHVKVVRAGEAVSYGLIWTAPTDRVIATVPIGYADGVPRRLGPLGMPVLLGGRRCPIVGRVTMDQILIDAGPAGAIDPAGFKKPQVSRGDEVVLLGSQGTERITPDEWALALDTISYEITCGISKRVPRLVVGLPTKGD